MINHLNNNKLSEKLRENEVRYALDKIVQVPSNESPYSYIIGLINPISEILKYPTIKEIMLKIIERYEECYHAHSLLLDWYIEEKNKGKCAEMFDRLIEIDYIRKKYWLWRKKQIPELDDVKISEKTEENDHLETAKKI